MAKIQFLQLPVPPPTYFAATGNVPLAAASLASALSSKEDPIPNISPVVIPPEDTDQMGDLMLLEKMEKEGADFVGISLYLWNTERSLYLANELKKKSKETQIIIGGPEVNEDNPFVLNSSGFDYAVSGEAEHNFRYLIKNILEKADPSNVPNVAYRDGAGVLSPFGASNSADFPLTDFPSPYTTGFLKVNPKRSTYLETVRGCKSQCTYCFYPKSSQTLRTLNLDETKKLIVDLKDQGARELVFLDPTFNHRPGFESLLDLLMDINSDGQMSMFAELRSEGVTPHLAKKMRKAGFNRIELGLQSVNTETLKRVKRYGDPKKVAEVAKLLAGEGMELLLDLIIGLPGDGPLDVEKGILFFLEHGLGEWVQAFPLSVLPGTAMRRTAKEDGILFMPSPPYRVIETSDFTTETLVESIFLAEEMLERRLDEFPRPFLCEKKVDIRDRTDLDFLKGLSAERKNLMLLPHTRHHSVWFWNVDWNLMDAEVFDLIDLRIQKEPYCTIDFVFPLLLTPNKNTISKILNLLNSKAPSYLNQVLRHRDENLQRRLVFLINKETSEHLQFLEEHFDDPRFFIYRQIHTSELKKMKKNGFYLVEGNLTEKDFLTLSKQMDSESVSFTNRTWEERWCVEVLGYGEI